MSRGIALPFHDLGARWGWVVSTTPRPLYPRERDPVPIVQEVGWAPEPVWTGAENLAPTVIRSPDRPARSESLYRLSYPGPSTLNKITEISMWRKCPGMAFFNLTTMNNFSPLHTMTTSQISGNTYMSGKPFS